jgi:hypothetical protein
MDMTLTSEDDSEFTIAFVVANGSGYGGYPAQELQHRITEMSVQALDYVSTVDCFAVTSWRNGRNGWSTNGVLVESGIRDEYEALDVGPAVDATTDQLIITNYEADAATSTSSDTITVWFKTSGATAGDYWEAYLFADDVVETCYMVRVRVGNYSATVHRIDAGTVGSALGTFAFNISDGFAGEYHRLDFKAVRTATKTRLRVYVDGNPSDFYDDATVAGRPSGGYAAVGLSTTNFTSGTLRIAAVVARRVS